VEILFEIPSDGVISKADGRAFYGEFPLLFSTPENKSIMKRKRDKMFVV